MYTVNYNIQFYERCGVEAPYLVESFIIKWTNCCSYGSIVQSVYHLRELTPLNEENTFNIQMELQLDIKPASYIKKSISLNKTMYEKTSIQRKSENVTPYLAHVLTHYVGRSMTLSIHDALNARNTRLKDFKLCLIA